VLDSLRGSSPPNIAVVNEIVQQVHQKKKKIPFLVTTAYLILPCSPQLTLSVTRGSGALI